MTVQTHQQIYPQIMGIINVTPDSFSDGGKHYVVEKAVAAGLEMQGQGADWLDIGGESTRPGAQEVSVQQELDRVIPVIEGIRKQSTIPISIDTSKALVMREAVSAGATMINDVYALQREGALQAAADCKVPVCLMHMQGTPKTMQAKPNYDSLIAEIIQFLQGRAEVCIKAGIKSENIMFDPGFGFGKTLEHNYALLAQLESFTGLEHKILVGISRKSMIANVVRNDTHNRLAGSLAAATLAMHTGAHVIRVHDVPETVDARAVYSAMTNAACVSRNNNE